MLEGKNINLRIIEDEDLDTYAEWSNDPNFNGEFFFVRQLSRTEVKKMYSERSPDWGTFIIEKKDGTKIGVVHYFQTKFGGYSSFPEIGYLLIPQERGNGYCTEAVRIIIDYLFLLKDVQRIQAVIDGENIASKRVLEKNGFVREGVIRKLGYIKGKYVDGDVFSILKEEWKAPT